MNDSMLTEQGPRPIERTPSPDALSASADIIVSNGFKRLRSETARKVNQWVKKGTLTASALSLILTSACGNTQQAEPQITPEPTPISIPFVPKINPDSETIVLATHVPAATTKTTPQSTEIHEEQEYSWKTIEGVKVAFDQDSLPVKYVLPDGQEVVLDREEIKKLKEKAISSKEPEIVTILRMDKHGSDLSLRSNKSSIEHPVLSELPDDVLSEEELTKKGVNIIQADSTHFYIRKEAFAKGALLEDFNNTGRKINIVLVDGPLVNNYFMSDARYDNFKPYFPEEKIEITPNQHRKNLLDDATRSLNFERDRLKDYETEYQKEIALIDPKVKQYELNSLSLISDDMLMQSLILGLVFSKRLGNEQHDAAYFGGNNPTIFLAVGENIEAKFVVLYFNAEGEIKIVSHPWGTSLIRDRSVKINDSYPNPLDFPIDSMGSSPDDPSSYPYGKSKTSGIELRHELKHDVLITQRLSKGEKPEHSEYKTDLEAMHTIREAWDKWVKSGYTDNSGYYFVFSLPKEHGGGYILTRKEKNRHKKLRKKLRAKKLKEISS